MNCDEYTEEIEYYKAQKIEHDKAQEIEYYKGLKESLKKDEITEQSDYLKYRGKCKELSEAAIAIDPTLRLVRGTYWCPMWGNQDHWWCEKPDGTIVDPSAKQFPSKGMGEYTEFNGICECAQCGNEINENKALFEGRYAFCSGDCRLRFVGLESFIKTT